MHTRRLCTLAFLALLPLAAFAQGRVRSTYDAYGLQGLNALILKGNFVADKNYYEDFVDNFGWWNTEPLWQ